MFDAGSLGSVRTNRSLDDRAAQQAAFREPNPEREGIGWSESLTVKPSASPVPVAVAFQGLAFRHGRAARRIVDCDDRTCAWRSLIARVLWEHEKNKQSLVTAMLFESPVSN
jgi:hypothetical protein